MDYDHSISLLHIYEMKRGPDSDFVVATNPDDASAVWSEATGLESGYAQWNQWPDDRLLTVTAISEPGRPKETKTCGEWAAKWGRGFASTDPNQSQKKECDGFEPFRIIKRQKNS